MRYAIIFAVVASAIVGGCGSFNSEQFQCPATEEGATCMSARQIYGATHVADRVAPNYRDGKPITDKQATHAIGSGDAELQPADANPKIQQRALVASPQQSDSYRPPVPDVDTPLPVRSPPQILRIRIFPWEDNARDLNAGTVVFTEVEGRTWTLGEEQVARVQASTPPFKHHNYHPRIYLQVTRAAFFGGPVSAPTKPPGFSCPTDTLVERSNAFNISSPNTLQSHSTAAS